MYLILMLLKYIGDAIPVLLVYANIRIKYI